jgi:hypothetical protein
MYRIKFLQIFPNADWHLLSEQGEAQETRTHCNEALCSSLLTPQLILGQCESCLNPLYVELNNPNKRKKSKNKLDKPNQRPRDRKHHACNHTEPSRAEPQSCFPHSQIAYLDCPQPQMPKDWVTQEDFVEVFLTGVAAGLSTPLTPPPRHPQATLSSHISPTLSGTAGAALAGSN